MLAKLSLFLIAIANKIRPLVWFSADTRHALLSESHQFPSDQLSTASPWQWLATWRTQRLLRNCLRICRVTFVCSPQRARGNTLMWKRYKHWQLGQYYETWSFCKHSWYIKYCEIIFIRWTLKLIYFVGRTVHKFQIRTDIFFTLVICNIIWNPQTQVSTNMFIVVKPWNLVPTYFILKKMPQYIVLFLYLFL